MSSDDYWRKKQEEERRLEAIYGAVRRGDYDTAEREAAGDNNLELLNLKGSRDVLPPVISSQQVAELGEERKNLLELIDCTGLDIHGRIKLIQMVHAINLLAPDASQKLDQMRMHIEKYI